MMHIEIENFQSIKKLSFDIDGFTTLVGRNFHGKSATLRAINAALTNRQGTDFIRWGEKFCEVKIKTNKIDIVWHKENGNNFYKVNGNDYLKIGSQPPPDPILEAGYGVLNVGGEKIDLLYAEQFFPLFLVNKRDSKSADLLISIYGLDRLYKAVDLCDKDRKKNKDLLKLRKGDRDIAEKNLERFKGIEEALAKIEELKKLKESIDKDQEELTKLKSLASNIVDCTIEVKRLKKIFEVVIPNGDSISKDINELETLKTKTDSLVSLKEAFTKHKKYEAIRIPEDTEVIEIQEELKLISHLKKQSLLLESTQKKLEKLKTVFSVEIPEAKINFDELDKLKNIGNNLVIVANEVKSGKAELTSLCSFLEEIDQELSSYKKCPACGSNLEKGNHEAC